MKELYEMVLAKAKTAVEKEKEIGLSAGSTFNFFISCAHQRANIGHNNTSSRGDCSTQNIKFQWR